MGLDRHRRESRGGASGVGLLVAAGFDAAGEETRALVGETHPRAITRPGPPSHSAVRPADDQLSLDGANSEGTTHDTSVASEPSAGLTTPILGFGLDLILRRP